MRKTLIVLPALIAILIAPPAFAQNYVLSLGGDGDYVEIADSESLSGDASRVAQNLSPRSESSATEDGLRTYLRTLGLALSVQRRNPSESRDVLFITARRVPRNIIWSLPVWRIPKHAIWGTPPALPVQIEIRDEADQQVAALTGQTEKTIEWAVPDDVAGRLRIVARTTEPSGDKQQAEFACQAHNIIPVTPKMGHWRTYDVTHGLGGSQVESIVQDRDGYLWFALFDVGVSRYDGHMFQTLTPQDGLPSDNIWTMLEDSRGNLWFGTHTFPRGGEGVFQYNGETFKLFTTEDGLIHNSVMAIHEDNRGHLWFGTPEGVSEFDGTEFRNYTGEDGLQLNWVGSIAQDATGNLWFGHGVKHFTSGWAGATRYDGKSFVYFDELKGSGGLTSIATDAQGHLWFGSVNGISIYDGKDFRSLTEADGLVDRKVNQVLRARNGDMWIATRNGVSRYIDGKLQSFTTKDGLASNDVSCIAEDREGNLWFGTSGVNQYDRSFRSIPIEIGIGIQDRQGNLWFEVSGVGLGRLERTQSPDGLGYAAERIRIFGTEDGLLQNQVTSIHEDREGILWIGSFNRGMSRYDGETFQIFTTEHGLTHFVVRNIYEDREGTLWIGIQFGGIDTYDGNRFVNVANPGDLGVNSDNSINPSDNWINPSDIIQDREGDLWFATNGHGVTRYDGKTFTRFTTEEGLPSNSASSLLEDSQGNIWIATSGGLCRYDGKTFRAYTMEDGLAGNSVGALFEDSQGHLWMGIDGGGVQKFDGRNFQHFTVDDGLLSNNVYTIEESESGEMIFFTAKGITIYTPPEGKIPPPVSLTSVTADEVYEAPKELKIPSTTPRISFAYRGISFSTRRMRYNYILEGKDVNWQATWEEEVTYEDLKPGNYVFKVVAIDRDLNYSEPAALPMVILAPPFYRTGIFLVALSIIGGISLFGVTILAAQRRRSSRAYKMAEQVQEAKMLSLRQLIAGVAHQINNPIGAIASNSDVASRAIDKIRKRIAERGSQEIKEDRQLTEAFAALDKMNEINQKASRGIAGTVADLRSFVRLDEAEWQRADIHKAIDSVLDLMKSEFSSRIKVTRDYGDIPRIYCSPSGLNQVFMSIFRNSCEAIAEEGEIHIRTAVQKEQIIIEISDTGTGISSQDMDRIFDPGFTTKGVRVGVGLGLSICYQIVVDEHKGHIDVSSESGRGTTFTITLPVYHDRTEKT